MSNLFKTIFPFLNVSFWSAGEESNKVLFYKGLANEHDFKYFVTDLSSVIQYKLFDEKTICSLEVPSTGIPYKIIIKLVSEYFDDEHQPKNYKVCLNYFDVVERRWDIIRDYFKSFNEHTSAKIFIGLDPTWLNGSELSKFFSLATPYENINPCLICLKSSKSVQPKNILNWAKMAKNSSLKPVSFFGPFTTEVNFIQKVIKTGFADMCLPARKALELVTGDN